MVCWSTAHGVSSPSAETANTSALQTNNLRPADSTSPPSHQLLPPRGGEEVDLVLDREHLPALRREGQRRVPPALSAMAPATAPWKYRCCWASPSL